MIKEMRKHTTPFSLYQAGDLVTITVKPGVACDELIYTRNTITIRLSAPAKDGKANASLIKFLKKSYDVRAVVVKGRASRIKTLRLLA